MPQERASQPIKLKSLQCATAAAAAAAVIIPMEMSVVLRNLLNLQVNLPTTQRVHGEGPPHWKNISVPLPYFNALVSLTGHIMPWLDVLPLLTTDLLISSSITCRFSSFLMLRRLRASFFSASDHLDDHLLGSRELIH